MTKLPVKIPMDLAEDLNVDPSMISHVNAGRKRLSVDKCLTIMEISRTDHRLDGIHYLDLRPEQEAALPWIMAPRGERHGR